MGEPTHVQSPGCNEGIREVHAGPDDPIMIEVDAMTADEALGSPTDSDHGYDDDDDDGNLADKVPPCVILLLLRVCIERKFGGGALLRVFRDQYELRFDL